MWKSDEAADACELSRQKVSKTCLKFWVSKVPFENAEPRQETNARDRNKRPKCDSLRLIPM